MSAYMIQGAYSAPATAAMVKNPQDRSAVVKGMVDKVGGKMLGFWLCLGEYDFVTIVDMPGDGDVTAAAFAMAVGSSGSMSAYRTTALLSSEEAVRAMKQAAEIAYQPPK